MSDTKQLNLNITKEIIYDPGDAKYQEDALIYFPEKKIFGVMDGVSGLYTPARGPRLIGKISEAQQVGLIATETIAQAPIGWEIKKILRQVNDRVKKFNMTLGLNLRQSELLPAVDLAVAQIKHDKINIIRTGDCFAVWQNKNGRIYGTPNQAYDYDSWMSKKLATTAKKFKGDWNRAWIELLPRIAEQRRLIINNKGFAMLNGQTGLYKSWQEILLPLKEIKILMLFTDGLVPFVWTKNEQLLARQVMNFYHSHGLAALLDKTRRLIAKGFSYSKKPEASAIVLKFN